MVILRPGGHVREPCTFIQIIVDVFLTHSQGIQLPPFDVGHETLKRSKGTEDMHMFSARVRAPEVFATNCPTRQKPLRCHKAKSQIRHQKFQSKFPLQTFPKHSHLFQSTTKGMPVCHRLCLAEPTIAPPNCWCVFFVHSTGVPCLLC